MTCGAGTQHRSVLCANNTQVLCEEARRPAGEAVCTLPPCLQGLDALGPDGSGSGSSSSELFNEITFSAPHPLQPPSPEPASTGNAIGGEGPARDLPGPIFVDDFYYDYNFINFHEDLSYGPFEEPEADPELAGTGDWTPPPLSRPDEPPTGTPTPATEPPAVEEGALGSQAPAPWPSQAGPVPPPPSDQTPGNPSENFLPEEHTPMGAPDLGLPGSRGPPASAGGVEMPTTPGRTDRPLGAGDSQSQPPPPRWERTNEVSEDNEVPPLPQRPGPVPPPRPSIGTAHPSPGPDSVELWTSRVVVWEPALQGGLGPTDRELWPTVGRAVLPAALPEPPGTDSPLEPGIPTLSTPGLAPRDLRTPAVSGASPLTALPGRGHTPQVASPAPGPPGQPWSPSPLAPSPAVPPSSVLPSTPAQNSRAPGVQPLGPSPAELGGPADLLPAKNASWEAGNWSEVGGQSPDRLGP